MAVDLTSRLPREQGRIQKASQQWRLSVGNKVGNRTENLGYWILKTRTRERGAKVVYKQDDETQYLLEEMAGKDPQPKVIPCSVIGNPIPDTLNPGKLTLPDSIIFRELACFGSGGRLCYCQNPQDVKPLAHRAIQEMKSARGKQFKVIAGYNEMPCSREHTDKPCQAFNADPPTCKPHVIVPLYLPWSGSSGAAVYRTTGWTAFNSMTDSLLAVAAMTGGWLHGLPLELVYLEEQTAQGFWVPAPQFRLRVDDAKKALVAANEMRLLCAGAVPEEAVEEAAAATVRQQAEPVREAIAETLADPQEQRETQEEFYPGATAEVIEAEWTAGEPSAEELAQIKQDELDAYERDYGEKQPQSLFPKEGK